MTMDSVWGGGKAPDLALSESISRRAASGCPLGSAGFGSERVLAEDERDAHKGTHPMSALQTRVLEPLACTPELLESFCSLVLEGGQVISYGLKDRVEKAFALAFVYEEKHLAAIGALKHPDTGYRASTFNKAGAKEDPAAFPYELGWVFVAHAYQGQKLSRLPVEALLPLASDKQLYATSHIERTRMHNTLRRYGFTQVGAPYESDIDDHKLLLFLRPAPTPVAVH
jgi:predicted GNAT family N-acyltransferase